MIGTTEAFTRQPINQLDCNTVGISRAQRMRTAKLPRNHGWTATRKEKIIREHSDARRAENENLGDREPA